MVLKLGLLPLWLKIDLWCIGTGCREYLGVKCMGEIRNVYRILGRNSHKWGEYTRICHKEIVEKGAFIQILLAQYTVH